MSGASTGVRLSRDQQRVVDHRGGDLQVIACAGSGKTESVSRRIAALLAEGVPPEGIVAFTFTERAAAELRERVVRRATEALGEDFRDRLGPLFVGTIHGYCFRLLQDHVPELGSHEVIDENRLAALLSRKHRDLGLDALGTRHWQAIRDFATTLDVIGNELIPDEALTGSLRDAVDRFRELADHYRLLTFGDLIRRAVRLLDDPDVRARVCGGLRHLVVDEFQDVNPAQVALVERLARPPVQLCVVGDDDQSIYQWRGSDVGHILRFATARPNVTTVNLADNRRSRPEIIRRADEFARSIPDRLDKSMRPVRADGEPQIAPWRAETPEDEAERLADTIARLREQGFLYREIGVLFRSVRTSAPPLLRALDERRIPYQCAGRTGLFLQADADLMARVFAWRVDQPWKSSRWGEAGDPVTLDDLCDGFRRRFGAVPEVRQWLAEWRAYHEDGRHAVSLVEDYYDLLELVGVARLNPDDPGEAARMGALARFSEVLADFEHVNRRGVRTRQPDGSVAFRAGRDRGASYFFALYSYLQHWGAEAYEDFPGEPAVTLDAVDILTVHQAKGLEWPVVFLPALNVRRFPALRAGRPRDWLLDEDVFPPEARRRYEGGDAEERRLLYVAMTRARDTLYLSCFRRMTRGSNPSPYLLEVAGRTPPDVEELPLPAPPDAREHPEPPAPEVSFSELASLDECGHQYRLGTRFGFQPALAVELGYGKAVHHALRQLAERTRATGTVPSVEERDEVVADAFYVPFATAPAFESMYRSARRLVERYAEQWADDIGRIWAVERPFALHFPEGVVTGRADLILDRENGRPDRLALVDYKVGADDDPREARYALQLQVYTAAGRAEGLQVDAAYLHHLRHSTRQPVLVDERSVRAARGRMGQLLGVLRAARFEPRPAEYRCGGCNVRKLCRHRVE